MKTSALILVGILTAAALTGAGCRGLHLALTCLQVLVFLAGFSGIVDWKWMVTLGLWTWTVVPATHCVPALFGGGAWMHFAIQTAVLFVKSFLFAR